MFRYLRLGSTLVRATLAGIAVVAGGIALVQSQRDNSESEGKKRRRKGGEGAPDLEKVRLHVVPDDDGWIITREGAEEPIQRFDLKEDAVESGRELAKRSAPASLTVHRSDGTIQRHHEYEAEE